MASIRVVVYVTVNLFTMSCHSQAQAPSSVGYGYGGVCEPGYGDDCSPGGSASTTTGRPMSAAPGGSKSTSTTVRPMFLALGGSKSTTTTERSMFAASGLQSDGAQKHSAGSGGAATVAMDTTSNSPDCNIRIPKACTVPFVYKGQSYDTCTGADSVGKKWCSTDAQYRGGWRECTNPCQHLMMQRVVTGVVATGIAAAGVGLIGASMNANKQAVSTSAPQALMTTMAASPGLLNVTAAPTVPPLLAATAGTPASIPASRLFEESSTASTQKAGFLRGQHVADHTTLLLCFGIGICTLCCCAALCGALLHLCGAQKKKANSANEVSVEEMMPLNQGS